MKSSQYVYAGSGLVQIQITDNDPPWGAIFLNQNTSILGLTPNEKLYLSAITEAKIKNIAISNGVFYKKNLSYDNAIPNLTQYIRGNWNDLIEEKFNDANMNDYCFLFTNVDEILNLIQIDQNQSIVAQINKLVNDGLTVCNRINLTVFNHFLMSCSEPSINFAEMVHLPATKKNVENFFRTGQSLMWPLNWEKYPYRAGRIAKQRIIDKQNLFLLTRRSGIYLVDGHQLMLIRESTNNQIER